MFRTIPIWEIDYYIESNNNAMIIDLRREESYRKSHIKGAVNLPYVDREEWMSDLPMNQLLIFYCSRGGQSMSVCRELEPYGFRLVNIANGIEYYRGKYMVRG
ncbi:rhodanese-like domain-containing protein [Lacrimispora sp.]|uniref:rhodanese-like domain-containing protein n=1 Tax=Lacrimispora sp. TaxID=2719234 RepID=UPI003460C19C